MALKISNWKACKPQKGSGKNKERGKNWLIFAK